MNVLGISCYFHDAAAAVLRDGVLIAAAEEERFSRRKHDPGFPQSAIAFCLRTAGVSVNDLDQVVFYERPLIKFDRIVRSYLRELPRSRAVLGKSVRAWIHGKLWMREDISRNLGIPKRKIHFVEHHLSHAASAFFCSPFEDAAVVTIDGVGEWTTAGIGFAQSSASASGRNQIKWSQQVRFPHSLGLFYSAFTDYLGFEVNEGEYKVMGMAPFGQPRFVDKVWKMIHLHADGSFELDLDYFSYHYSIGRTCSPEFAKLMGYPPRQPEREFYTAITHPDRDDDGAHLNQVYADIAASVQKVTEEVVLAMVLRAHQLTGSKRLCLAGGVALNSVANGRILEETPFEEIWIQPASGDAGGAVGAALYFYCCDSGKDRRFTMEHAYWGEEYSSSAIHRALTDSGLEFSEMEEDHLIARSAEAMQTGKVLGLFQGRFEWGPRALGNRSIVADPRSVAMKQIVNTKIKFREPFRPFAPVVPRENAADYFDLGKAGNSSALDYMLMVRPVKAARQQEIAACSHFGTGRVQTVSEKQNPFYYRLVRKFGESTGVPVLVNTSFNVRGEPMVASPIDAIRTFKGSGLDLLVIPPFVAEKRT